MDPYFPHSLNLYQYVGNNPINRWDPMGLEWFYLDEFDEEGNVTGQSWQYFEDTPEITILENTYDEGGKITGTVERTVTGVKELLQFDGDSLNWYHEEGHISTFPAVSGRSGTDFYQGRLNSNWEFEVFPGTHPSRQWDVNVGPIPEGQYSINPFEIQRWGDLSTANKIGSAFSKVLGPIRSVIDGNNKVGGWPGGTFAWGRTRVQINPQSVTNPQTGVTRSGFFIHGGLRPGSAGCIDLTSCNGIFFKSFSKSSSPIPLYVQYPGGD